MPFSGADDSFLWVGKPQALAYIPKSAAFQPFSSFSSPSDLPLSHVKSWYQIVVAVPSEALEKASNVLFEAGSTGLEEVSSQDGTGRLIAYFAGSNQRAVLHEVRSGLPEARINASQVELEDWSAAWRDRFEPVWPTDRLVVCAPWHDVSAPADGYRVVIEPRTAFGTGGHATTRLALQALEGAVRPGDRVLDVGTGSGILAIAARKMGAQEVTAIDTDPLAVQNVIENAALNGVDGIQVEARSLELEDRGYRVAVANIISSILRPMLGRLHSATEPGAVVIFGGLLSRERESFASSLEAGGFKVVDVLQEAEWIGFTTSKS